MENQRGPLPLIICGVIVILSVLLVVVGHRQGDANAAAAATATAQAPTQTPRPASPAASAAQLSLTPAAKPSAAS